MAMLVRDETQKSHNNLYPSFADMQSNQEQNADGGMRRDYIEHMPEEVINNQNNRRSERSLS